MRRIDPVFSRNDQRAEYGGKAERSPSRKRVLHFAAGALASVILGLPSTTGAQPPPAASLTITVQDPTKDPPACAGVMTFLYKGKLTDLCDGKPCKTDKDCKQPKPVEGKATGADGKVTYSVKAAAKGKTDDYVVSIKKVECVCDPQYRICVVKVFDHVPFTVDDKGNATATGGATTTRSHTPCP